jgi:hypothetical protein
MDDKKRIEILCISCTPRRNETMPVLMISIENETGSDIGFIRILPDNIIIYKYSGSSYGSIYTGQCCIDSCLIKNKQLFIDHVRDSLKNTLAIIPGYYVSIQDPKMMEEFLYFVWEFYKASIDPKYDSNLLKLLPLSLVSYSEFLSKMNKIFTM